MNDEDLKSICCYVVCDSDHISWNKSSLDVLNRDKAYLVFCYEKAGFSYEPSRLMIFETRVGLRFENMYSCSSFG